MSQEKKERRMRSCTNNFVQGKQGQEHTKQVW